jgi:hypothetical protein
LTRLIAAVIVISGAVSELAAGRNTPMYSIQTMYAALIALGVVVGISVALTLTIEGAGALYVRDQIRALLERSHTTIPAQQPTPAEDARVLVLR